MSTSCKNLRTDFIRCLRESECMTRDKKSFHDCRHLMKENDPSIQTECYDISYAFFVCKRGQLDMRKRFRGNTDTALGKGEE